MPPVPGASQKEGAGYDQGSVSRQSAGPESGGQAIPKGEEGGPGPRAHEWISGPQCTEGKIQFRMIPHATSWFDTASSESSEYVLVRAMTMSRVGNATRICPAYPFW